MKKDLNLVTIVDQVKDTIEDFDYELITVYYKKRTNSIPLEIIYSKEKDTIESIKYIDNIPVDKGISIIVKIPYFTNPYREMYIEGLLSKVKSSLKYHVFCEYNEEGHIQIVS